MGRRVQCAPGGLFRIPSQTRTYRKICVEHGISSSCVRLYAERRRVRNRQMARDAVVVAWCALWVWVGRWIFHFISKLGGIGHSLQNTSAKVDSGVHGLPSLLRSVGGPLKSIGEGLSSAGSAQITVVHDIAMFFALLIALCATVPVLTVHIARRIVWIRRVRAVLLMRASPHFPRLMAERALLRQPLHKLAAVSNDPVQDIKDGHYEALAALELSDAGIRQSA